MAYQTFDCFHGDEEVSKEVYLRIWAKFEMDPNEDKTLKDFEELAKKLGIK